MTTGENSFAVSVQFKQLQKSFADISSQCHQRVQKCKYASLRLVFKALHISTNKRVHWKKWLVYVLFRNTRSLIYTETNMDLFCSLCCNLARTLGGSGLSPPHLLKPHPRLCHFIAKTYLKILIACNKWKCLLQADDLMWADKKQIVGACRHLIQQGSSVVQ